MPAELLTVTLKAQHESISQLVDRIDSAIARRDGAAVKRLIPLLKSLLFAHLDVEDAALYPTLLAGADVDARDTTRSFAKALVRLSETLVDFFERHQTPALNDGTFEQDWHAISRIISARMKSEERDLFGLYEQLTAHRGRKKAG